MTARQHSRDFREIAVESHRHCLVPAAVADAIGTAVRRRLLELGLKEVDLSVAEEALWARAYGSREPVTHAEADVVIDRGGYRINGAPVCRIAVRGKDSAELGGEIFSVFLEHGVAPSVMDVVDAVDETGQKKITGFVFILLPQKGPAETWLGPRTP